MATLAASQEITTGVKFQVWNCESRSKINGFQMEFQYFSMNQLDKLCPRGVPVSKIICFHLEFL